jgi:hypothetical protein
MPWLSFAAMAALSVSLISVIFYAGLLYRTTGGRELTIVLAGAAVVIIRTMLSVVVPEYHFTMTPNGAIGVPNAAHHILAILALAGRVAVIYGLFLLWRRRRERLTSA